MMIVTDPTIRLDLKGDVSFCESAHAVSRRQTRK